MSPSTQHVKSAELLVPGTAPEHTGIRTFLLPLGKDFGGIFCLATITSRDENARERFLHILGSHLEIMRSDLVKEDINIPRRFESMLVTVNADLARFAQTYSIPLKHITIALGVMTNTQVFFSGVGTNHILFLHRTAQRRYVVYELDAQLANQESTWEKLLVTVLDGELHPGDVMYIATKIPQHALTIGDLQDILVTLPPNGALERVQQFVPAAMQYGGICFHVSEDAPAGPPKKMNPLASIASFEETKSRTADLLGDQAPDVRAKVSALIQQAKTKLSTYSTSAPWRAVKRLLRAVLSLVDRALGKHADNASPSRYGRNRGTLSAITTKIFALRHAGITAVKDTSRTVKVIGISSAIVVVIIAIVIGAHQSQKQAAQASVAYDSLVTKIEEKRNAAEAALIYGDTQNAQTLILDAKTLLATIPKNTSAEQNKADTLSRALDELLGKTRGLETVVPTQIATLPEGFTSPLIGLASTTNGIYGISADGAPWRVNDVSKTLDRTDIGTSPAQNALVTAAEGDNLLALDMDKRLWRSTTGTPSIAPLTSGTDGMASVDDIFSYNNNLYALSAASSQIVKMRPQGLGFEAGTPWISAKTSDISQAKALAIDGNVWVLTANNIVVFSSGKETSWDHAAIDPALAKPIDLWTDVDSSYLYILDGSDGRVVVMDKARGGIVAQYVANIPGVIGFAVREGENRILLATPTTVYTYTATHLLK